MKGRTGMCEFKDKIVIVTGGAKGIGKCIADMFSSEGAKVCIIDILPSSDNVADLYYQGDVADPEVLHKFSSQVLERFGHVDCLINNALPLFKGIDECSYALTVA